VHSPTKLKQSIGGIERPDEILTYDESEMAEILNNFFSSVFTNEHWLSVPSIALKCLGEPLLCIHLSMKCVWKQLCKLNPSKSGGPDNCHPCVLKKVYFNLCFLYLKGH